MADLGLKPKNRKKFLKEEYPYNLNKANLVRGIMYRTHYSQEYRKSSFERFEECFEEIFNN